MQGPVCCWRSGWYERLTEVWEAAAAEWPAAGVVEGQRGDLAAVGSGVGRSAQTDRSSRPQAVSGARLFGGDLVSAPHGDALCRPAARARFPERRDVSAQAARVDRARCLAAGVGASGLRTRPAGQARLVARGCRRVDRGREKGGDLVGPSPVNRGFASSKYHLVVDAAGWPLEVRLGPGNENERAHLLPLIDALSAAGYRPGEVWADRGYCSDPLRAAIQARGITPKISKRRRAGDPLQPGQTSRPGARGRKRVTKTSDPLPATAGSSNAPSPGYDASADSPSAPNQIAPSTSPTSPSP